MGGAAEGYVDEGVKEKRDRWDLRSVGGSMQCYTYQIDTHRIQSFFDS